MRNTGYASAAEAPAEHAVIRVDPFFIQTTALCPPTL